MTPPRSMTMAGEWPSRTPMSPSEAGITTISTGRDISRRSGLTISRFTGMGSPVALCLQAFGLFHRVLDRADHVERGLWQVVVLAGAHGLEAADRIGDRHEHAGEAGEHLGHVERLRKEALDLARAGDDELVLFRELVHAQDRDDVLQRLVGLQDALRLASNLVVLLAHDAWVQ